ncbi:LOW QUALITY PROTEIN: hypothetical protein QTO34_014987 [Cnephaeus nilssonii]|uniref:RNase H type-1 domain-containing protein n=1 Tax=Cnephaeus nilssonii TaxID=3371016 RepID=A0AA40H9X1_CNENI|nr:LOW QUALITY PROTEIN: hypothetical protein QTO34_014987 [Eptesicus nilssonii]
MEWTLFLATSVVSARSSRHRFQNVQRLGVKREPNQEPAGLSESEILICRKNVAFLDFKRLEAWEQEDISPGSHRTNCLFSLDIKKDCRPRKDTVTHSFLVMPECPYPKCRCDLLQKLFGLPPYPLRGTEREFLEAVGYYNLWIPGLIEIAKPLDSIEQWAFEELKKALISAPALALPDVTKPFHLHVSGIRGIAKGVLTQTLDPWKRPVAYLSKRLDPVAAGWPACLRAVATTVLLVKEADKQTLGRELALTTPHGVEALLRALLLDQPCVRFHKTRAINPASLLLDDDPEEPIHDCTEVTDAVQMPCPDLTDAPLSSPDKLCSGWHLICRAAVVTLDRTIWAQSLNRGTTAQKVELLVLIQALRWGHSAIHRKRGLPTAVKKDIKNKEEILALLKAIWLPRAVAMVHCKGHQKGKTIEARGNGAADQTAKEAAQKKNITLPDLDLRRPPLTPNKRRNWQNRSKPLKDRMVGGPYQTVGPRGSRSDVSYAVTPGYPLGVTKTSELLQGSQDISKYSSSLRTGMSKTQKKNLTKFILETGENWTNLLPFTLFWARCTPYWVRKKLKAGIHNHSLTQALQYTQRATHKLVCDALPMPTADPVHPFQPRDSIWVKKLTAQGLTPT